MAGTNNVVSSRPEILVDGTRKAGLESGLISLSIRRTEGRIADCEAEFSNWGNRPDGSVGWTLFDGADLDFGRRLEFKLGDGSLFDGRILAIEGRFPSGAPPVLVVRADDGLQALRMVRRTRSFERISDADAVRRIAGDHGIPIDIDMPGPTHPVLVQSNQTDLAFAQERARHRDADLWLQDGTLHARPRSSRQGAGFDLVLARNLMSFSATADLAHQRTELVVSGWDVERKAAISRRIGSDALARESASGRTGVAILQERFGDRVDSANHGSPFDDQEALGWGEARFLAAARRFARGRGVAVADARLIPASRIGIRGVGPLFEGEWDVVEIEHRFDGESGLRTEIVVERAWIGNAA